MSSLNLQKIFDIILFIHSFQIFQLKFSPFFSFSLLTISQLTPSRLIIAVSHKTFIKSTTSIEVFHMKERGKSHENLLMLPSDDGKILENFHTKSTDDVANFSLKKINFSFSIITLVSFFRHVDGDGTEIIFISYSLEIIYIVNKQSIHNQALMRL